MKTQAIHWSQVQIGMTIKATKTIWFQVQEIGHWGEGWLVVNGINHSGSLKGKGCQRWISKANLIETKF